MAVFAVCRGAEGDKKMDNLKGVIKGQLAHYAVDY